MKKLFLTSVLLAFITLLPSVAQPKPENKSIDILLINGDFKKVIDTCRQVLATDSLNPEIYYKLGLAYQSLLSDDKAFDCFQKASLLSPENNNYKFTVAKGYYNKGRLSAAKPILSDLCAADSLNWPYSSYLAGIFMQEEKYDDAIGLYKSFYKRDSANYVLADKLGFAYLREEEPAPAIRMFTRSLSLNKKNLNAIKNLAYLYAQTIGADTAVQLLTSGIAIDSSDMDLYARRAAINYTVYNYKDALHDYQKLLSSGDSSFLNLKRTGLSSAQVLQPKKAVKFLLKAYDKDTTDLEVMSNIALNYKILGETKKSISYYKKFLSRLEPLEAQLGLGNILLAEQLKNDGQYTKAVSAYLKSQEFRSDDNVIMIVANLYDEKLKDTPKAIRYYEMYLNRIKNAKDYNSKYVESIRARLDALKNPNPALKR
jgi:tetratricopeptide (TPR) repeat protein